MIRIGYVLDPAYEGGAERYLLRLARSIDRNRFEPMWLLRRRPSLEELIGKARLEGIEVVETRGDLAGSIRRTRPAIVHLNMPSSYDLGCGAASLAARVSGARAVVATEHIVDIAPSFRRGLLKRAFLPFIDRVIAISGAHRDILARRHCVPARKIRLIRNGVEDPGPPSPDKGPLRIICIGALEHRKGQDVLIAAFADVLGRGVDARLVLAGDGPDRERLLEAAKARGITDRIEFSGRVESPWPELLRSHIAAVPSRREGIPFAVLEALAAGVPVVASELPGMWEVIESGVTGFLVPPENPKSLADRLADLATDPALRRRLAVSGRAVYESSFSAARMGAETTALYEEVLR